MKNYINKIPCIVLVFVLFSCKIKHSNYIIYYNRVNEIDSILRFQKDSLKAYKMYKKLFKKYDPKNQFRIEEFKNYILIADKLKKRFGGKKSLNKLIELEAENQYFLNDYTLYKKYKIDSIVVKSRIDLYWKKSLNKILVDSFSVAFRRDQIEQRQNIEILKINDRKNSELFKWTLKKYLDSILIQCEYFYYIYSILMIICFLKMNFINM